MKRLRRDSEKLNSQPVGISADPRGSLVSCGERIDADQTASEVIDA